MPIRHSSGDEHSYLEFRIESRTEVGDSSSGYY